MKKIILSSVLFVFIFSSCQNYKISQALKKAEKIFTEQRDNSKYQEIADIMITLDSSSKAYKSRFREINGFLQKVYDEYEILKKYELIEKYKNTLIIFQDDIRTLKFTTIDGERRSNAVNRGYTSAAFTPKWSHNGQFIVFSAEAGGISKVQLHLLDLKTLQTSELTKPDKGAKIEFQYYKDINPNWSADDELIVYEKSGWIYILDMNDKTVSSIYPMKLKMHKKKYSDSEKSYWQWPDELWPGGWPLILNDNNTVFFNIKNELFVTSAEMENPVNIFDYFRLDNSLKPNLFSYTSFEDPVLSYNNEMIAVFKDGHVKILNSKTFERIGFINGFHPSWSFDDEYILVNSFEGSESAFYISPVKEDSIFPNLRIFIGYGDNAFWSPELDQETINNLLSAE